VTEQPQPAPAVAQPLPEPAPAAAVPEPPASTPAVGAQDRPEIAVGAAFAGGFLAALILKRLAR
jgi:hypothetical protein